MREGHPSAIADQLVRGRSRIQSRLLKKRELRLKLLLMREGHPSAIADQLVASLRAGRGVNSEWAVEMLNPRTFEIDTLKRELDKNNRKDGRLDEALRERDYAMLQVKAEKQEAMEVKR
ncbi:uncharacterized protein A4U43_C05F10820 [Asparagus officinalis]|uniref:Uncharacterized protein n=1 Tax=Asparagus officinalis TaxID=4686 RepID=A0A5P1EW77_ASPOF|nr:uncharacterized protein A4U43_C05F10820 [Asparagus officinalis]